MPPGQLLSASQVVLEAMSEFSLNELKEMSGAQGGGVWSVPWFCYASGFAATGSTS